MDSRTRGSIFLFLVTIVIYLFQPWPFNVIFTSVTGYVFYTSLIAAAILLIVSKSPQRFIDPAGKAVFITGCDSGFGQELAKLLDARGFHVFAGCLSPDGAGAKNLVDVASERLKTVRINVTDDLQVSQAVAFVKDNLSGNELWAVVNNAGVAAFCEIEWTNIKVYMKLMDINVFGTVRVTKGFLPLLRQSEGRVINVASLAGRLSLPYYSAYSMSKKACIAFSDCLRQEMRKFNITVITIEPGLYKTPISSVDNLLNANKEAWDQTPQDVKKDYGDEYFESFLRLVPVSVSKARPNIEEVTDSMIHAVSAEHPETRYVPYWGHRLRAFIIGCLPVSVFDNLFASRLPTSVPEISKNKTPKKPKLLS